MNKRAYRFVPCDKSGAPREGSQYTTITENDLAVGSRIEGIFLGYTTWEVVEVHQETRPLLGARDEFGHDVPLGGTIVCRGVN